MMRCSIIVEVKGSSIELPLRSTPFSMFSHAADLVNTIHMEGVFHSNLYLERVGINIDSPTPSVRLEVNGAVRVADFDTEVIGAIRYRDGYLQGRHNDEWKRLDIDESDGYSSKWKLNDDESAISVFNKKF